MREKFKAGWYVLYVRSCQEKKVHSLLIEGKFDSFLPMFNTVRQWSDRKKFVSRPLFPSYVFVKINSTHDFNKALSVQGACLYIRFGREYAMVREEEITMIKLLVGADISDLEISPRYFSAGDVKTISYGPLRGLECEVLKVNNANKILVRINSLQQQIIATIPSFYLQEKPVMA